MPCGIAEPNNIIMEMLQMSKHKVVIIGSGPAGCTAAIYAARANLSPVVITGMNEGGQLIQTPDIQNWPGETSISGYDLMEKLINHAKSLGAEFISDEISEADLSSRPFTLKGDAGEYQADSVIIATGANPKYLGLESEEKFKGNGVSACATCDGFFFRNQPVAVIGGGNTALTEALYLSDICSSVYLVHRRDSFRAEKAVIDRIQQKIDEGRITPVYNAVTDEILGDDLKGVTGLRVKYRDDRREEISVSGIFVAIGHTPNTGVFAGQLETDNGTIITGVNPKYRTSASIPGVFAAGDCADSHYRQAITSAGTGCQAALDAEKFLQEAG
jgi:thioredoxin reductase (NADPH)